MPFGEELFAGYGTRTSGQGYAANTQADGQRKQFTGKERDKETGLNYFGSRYHSSVQGRFTSPDEPLLDQLEDDPQSWNLYSYVRNNPLRFIDPTGEAVEQVLYADDKRKKDKERQKCIDGGLGCYNPETGRYEINGNEGGTFINATVRPDMENDMAEFAQKRMEDEIRFEASPTFEPAVPGAGVFRGAMKRGGGAILRRFLSRNAGRASASKILGRNMIARFIKRPAGTAAHHIVAFKAEGADLSRRILKRFKIGINDAENGVFLDQAAHAGLHSNVYYAEVEKLLFAAPTRAKAIEVLKYIADELVAGRFPH